MECVSASVVSIGQREDEEIGRKDKRSFFFAIPLLYYRNFFIFARCPMLMWSLANASVSSLTLLVAESQNSLLASIFKLTTNIIANNTSRHTRIWLTRHR